AFFKILSKVFPLLLFPFCLAWILKHALPKIHQLLRQSSGVAFYLWALALAIVTGQTLRTLLNSQASVAILVVLASMSLMACAVQFLLGKSIGGHYHERISGGQALGQKNTVLAIWMAYTYLNPILSFSPGAYVFWQNIVNSYQLWKKRKNS
ncbi:MAG: transporter, partial [Bacteroides sp.]|nr:transporter [Bacteroides sp.]